jgi:hypothetical protein
MFVTVLTETRIDRKRIYRGLPVYRMIQKYLCTHRLPAPAVLAVTQELFKHPVLQIHDCLDTVQIRSQEKHKISSVHTKLERESLFCHFTLG